jgi:two-component system cell cycle sensor histidine kinase/response regulator CckA
VILNKKAKLILFCEDESVIRTTTKRMLEACGFEVITAANGHEALARYEERHEEIDIVILDNLLPGLAGYEVYKMMKKINPKIKAIMCSGYSNGKEYQKARKSGIRYFLSKPYIIEELLEILEQIQSI